ncbi:hypothetical protein G4B88_003590 [Cannabis sativa]|uniref:ATP synthase protein MI25 n=1 Tax=Cannabis sativa TaxID=3483 RepID=A0A7J6EHQ8_CANSA|nr:hypothetical protein G4B88_003590 [Cannabis sativa]
MEKEPLSVGGGRSDAGPSTFRPTEKLEIPPSQIDEDLFWQEVMNSAEEKREAAPTPARITGGATAHRSPLARVSRHVQGAREAHRADPPSSENGWNAYPGRKAHGALGRHDRGRAWGNAKSSAYPLGYAEQRPGEVRAFLAGRAHPILKSFPKPLPVHRKSLGDTFKVTLYGRIQAIQEELQQFLNPNEVVLLESNEQQRLLRICLRICGTVVESLPMARCAPKCEKTVQALLCRNLNVKSATLPNATSSRRICLQDDLVTGFHFSVSERFVPGCTLKASIVELI